MNVLCNSTKYFLLIIELLTSLLESFKKKKIHQICIDEVSPLSLYIYTDPISVQEMYWTCAKIHQNGVLSH